ncbi:hypothetical protein [Hymenobacter cellulosilyticus]|uniref:Uncharacterized protein n=1 Tax=Hymenobacter cellulosilyticus TaxID=2932248 RepID=A0A8T9QBG2_9BACT|nr:hypothetical protein [Hymenobacter cellulosilyticus]UOQ72879.1 hypothetical protein MUN79_02500 [Hymenobacter cellulosilyticus]
MFHEEGIPLISGRGRVHGLWCPGGAANPLPDLPARIPAGRCRGAALGVFHRYQQHAKELRTALSLSAAEVDSARDLAAVKTLFRLEPITGLRVMPDSTIHFSFGCGGSDWQSKCLAIVYLPNPALLSSRLPRTTISKRSDLGNGWYRVETVTSVAD